MTKVLLVDNYDSFVYNLYQYLATLGAHVDVQRNDQIDLATIQQEPPTHIVISPGPGHPKEKRDIGISGELITMFMHDLPILGVCLGCQTIAHVLGGQVVRAPSIVHGKTDEITHNGRGLFAGLPPSIDVMRYHSLMVDGQNLPDALHTTAQTADGITMGIAHQVAPLVGLQFHPESIGTPNGLAMLQNFLEMG